MEAKITLIERQKHLEARREKKLQILNEGGQQALSHSYDDIKRIDFALKRIAEGQYGLCCHCGCEISEARLNAIPETPLCIECASQ